MRISVTAHRGNFNFHLSFSKVLHQNNQCLTLIVCIYIIPVGIHSIFWLCCVQAVMFWKHSVWYTCAVSICKLINGSQFPVLVFLMLCERKLNRPDVHNLRTICIDWRIMFSNYFQPFSLQVNRLVYRINFQEWKIDIKIFNIYYERYLFLLLLFQKFWTWHLKDRKLIFYIKGKDEQMKVYIMKERGKSFMCLIQVMICNK